MKIAFSPCPNDTFIFHAWVHGLIANAPKLDVTYADINITNHLATSPEGLDVMKISYATLPYVLSDYALIPCGGALGRGCGPLLLTAEDKLTAKDLIGKKIAVPSERSSAYLLFRLWLAEKVPQWTGEIVVMPFEQIMPAVRDGSIDAGLVIHEARFTFHQFALTEMVDLGHWWEEDTGLPIPLGAIIAKRSLDTDAIANWIRQSLAYAWKHPQASEAYILEHAQEMSMNVVKAHINLYVNNYSLDLGEEGYKAVLTLLDRAAQESILPSIEPKLLRS
ncbi:1,4-dihydroxy-6-naphthoate synthase [Desulfuribacillus alkaliarsenatis]|uniref:1,4-dihydroxy-6-naphtoate synthase n=1 Tax=Desulfuribacillus alkaliarsenatis TaxID=766136 RepID=A0A1E5G5B7_9FIRM|nr:1,4-dihydroxy-6-naphthoate synthase [Desulfuribacillus alkaliarsenatis]OEF98387.1 1,4-dihydroxy-6-naphthoate synthase [Desulfuribacillus alkaliarsenatis]